MSWSVVYQVVLTHSKSGSEILGLVCSVSQSGLDSKHDVTFSPSRMVDDNTSTPVNSADYI